MAKIQGLSIFEGPDEARTLALDTVALHKNIYRDVGKMIAVCLIQGGVSPNFFSRRLLNQISGIPPEPATLQDISDFSLREKLEKIANAETLHEAREAINNSSEELALMGDGCTTPLTARDLVELFKYRSRAPPGSNVRRRESRALAYWKDWLLEVEGGQAQPVTLEHVLIFATGLKRMPAMGFSPGTTS